jgi:hypothetical protein
MPRVGHTHPVIVRVATVDLLRVIEGGIKKGGRSTRWTTDTCERFSSIEYATVCSIA